MLGRPRIVLPGTPLHLIQRGNNRQACFYARRVKPWSVLGFDTLI